jgi:hypothetical protein
MCENDLSAEVGITMLLSLKTTDRRGAIAVIYNYYKLFLTWGNLGSKQKYLYHIIFTKCN